VSDRWTEPDIGDQGGRVAVVTGGNVGLGLETARLLAQHGATVVLACRDQGKATAAAAEIRRSAPAARIDPLPLDLGSLDSVRSAVETLRTLHQRVDLLINNAGVMRPPRAVTSDGFELQLGTDHLGHFALIGLVLDLLLPLAGSRVVTVSSVLHHRGKIDFDDLQSVRRYDKAAAYAQSKLANLLFALDLDGRLTRSGAATISVAAHPGIARTTLSRHMVGPVRAVLGSVPVLTHSAAQGALSIVRAAVDPQLGGGEYVGPGGWQGFTGSPVVTPPGLRALDADVQRWLWEESERLTGVTYDFGPSGG